MDARSSVRGFGVEVFVDRAIRHLVGDIPGGGRGVGVIGRRALVFYNTRSSESNSLMRDKCEKRRFKNGFGAKK